MDVACLADLSPTWREAFDLAWQSWCAGSLGIGAVLADNTGTVVARGRNRVLENATTGQLAGTLIAHAEMDAFAALGLRSAESLTLYTTVEPCLMCAATSIALRTERIVYAATDPVFNGLGEVLAAHSYVTGRLPSRERRDDDLLTAFAAVLPLANRVWSRPGCPPRNEWIRDHAALWATATSLVHDGTLSSLQEAGATLDEAVAALAPALSAVQRL
jgi:tRNA(Arg) A34 adenosine deaminase TadA